MSNHPGWLYGGAAFVLGGGVMAVEMTAARLMAPFFGSSFFVWTALIVTILLAMSFGYWYGGRIAVRFASAETLGRLMAFAALTVVLCVLFMPSIVLPLRSLVSGFQLMPVVLFLGSLCTALAFFGCPVFLLAAAGPILLKLWAKGEDTGLAAGRYFAVSTIGSVFGTIVPSLVLVPLIGSRLTYAGVGLVMLAGASVFLRRRDAWLSLGIFVMMLSFSFMRPESASAEVLAKLESPYQHIEVWQVDGWRYLIFNDQMGIQTALAPDNGLTGMYYDYYGVIPHLRPMTSESRVAVLGLAGGSAVHGLVRELPAGVRPMITGVEIDGAVLRLGREFFGLDELGIETVVMDGRMFLDYRGGSYDVVLVDAYSNQFYIPAHLVSREFFALARRRLNEGGLLVLNVNAVDRDSPILTVIANTIASEFRHVGLVKIPDSWNWLVIASDEPIAGQETAGEAPAFIAESIADLEEVTYQPDGDVFTDDWAPLELMTDMMFVQRSWR